MRPVKCYLGPRVRRSESIDGLADRIVQLGRQAGHVGQDVNIAGRHPAGIVAVVLRREDQSASLKGEAPRWAVTGGKTADS